MAGISAHGTGTTTVYRAVAPVPSAPPAVQANRTPPITFAPRSQNTGGLSF